MPQSTHGAPAAVIGCSAVAAVVVVGGGAGAGSPGISVGASAPSTTCRCPEATVSSCSTSNPPSWAATASAASGLSRCRTTEVGVSAVLSTVPRTKPSPVRRCWT